jgi:serine/threonine protein phosphatase PrpC
MGNLLAAPVTDKETHVGKTDEFEFGVSTMQGWRVHMEDAHIAEPNLYALDCTNDEQPKKLPLPGHSFFCVFDGHGGTFAAEYCGGNMLRILSRQPMFVKYAQFCEERKTKEFADAAEKVQYLRSGIDSLEAAFKQAFIEMDHEIAMAIRGAPHADMNKLYHEPPSAQTDGNANANADTDATMEDAIVAAQQAAANTSKALDDDGDSGTTSVCVLVTPDWIVCANAGDSRSVYSKAQHAVPLSYDHKPDDEEEERRIRAAGGYVAGGRVEGDLAVSRGLGDFRFKHMPTVMSSSATGASETTPSSNTSIMNPGDQKVSPIPDIIVQNRNPELDEFIIVACDGIWDVQTNQECVQDVATLFQEGESDLGLVCEEVRLFLYCCTDCPTVHYVVSASVK